MDLQKSEYKLKLMDKSIRDSFTGLLCGMALDDDDDDNGDDDEDC